MMVSGRVMILSMRAKLQASASAAAVHYLHKRVHFRLSLELRAAVTQITHYLAVSLYPPKE